MTIRELTEMARFEFRRYGFRADGGTIRKKGEMVDVDFDPEPPTGQAAFSQSSVLPYLRIWRKLDVLGLLLMDYDIVDPVVELGISYEHYGKGSNGATVDYDFAEVRCGSIGLRRRQ
jgi:hypothetical protein